MKTTCLIKQNIQNYENFNVLFLTRKQSQFLAFSVSKVCANFNIFEQFSEELHSKTNNVKTKK